MQVTSRTRFSDARSGVLGLGLPAEELWGASTRDRTKPRRHRSPAAVYRRQMKRAAKLTGYTLKAYLRREAKAGRAR